MNEPLTTNIDSTAIDTASLVRAQAELLRLLARALAQHWTSRCARDKRHPASVDAEDPRPEPPPPKI